MREIVATLDQVALELQERNADPLLIVELDDLSESLDDGEDWREEDYEAQSSFSDKVYNALPLFVNKMIKKGEKGDEVFDEISKTALKLKPSATRTDLRQVAEEFKKAGWL